MRFTKDKVVGYRIDTCTTDIERELYTIIEDQYYDEKKELGVLLFDEEIRRTREAILNDKYTAWIDIWEDDDILHIEPDYGLGNIDIIISGVEI